MIFVEKWQIQFKSFWNPFIKINRLFYYLVKHSNDVDDSRLTLLKNEIGWYANEINATF